MANEEFFSIKFPESEQGHSSEEPIPWPSMPTANQNCPISGTEPRSNGDITVNAVESTSSCNNLRLNNTPSPTNELQKNLETWDPMGLDYACATFNSYEKFDILASEPPKKRSLDKLIKSPPQRTKQEEISLYVANIPIGLTQEGLRNLFQPVGKVKSCCIIPPRDPNYTTTIGFVTFETWKEASRGIECCDGFSFGDGAKLRVRVAHKKKQNDSDVMYSEEDYPSGSTENPVVNGFKESGSDSSTRSQSPFKPINQQIPPIDSGHPSSPSPDMSWSTNNVLPTPILPDHRPTNGVSARLPLNASVDVSFTASPNVVPNESTPIPSVSSKDPTKVMKSCSVCKKLCSQYCSFCKAPYCSRECQRKDRPNHMKICGYYQDRQKPVEPVRSDSEESSSSNELDYGFIDISIDANDNHRKGSSRKSKSSDANDAETSNVKTPSYGNVQDPKPPTRTPSPLIRQGTQQMEPGTSSQRPPSPFVTGEPGTSFQRSPLPLITGQMPGVTVTTDKDSFQITPGHPVSPSISDFPRLPSAAALPSEPFNVLVTSAVDGNTFWGQVVEDGAFTRLFEITNQLAELNEEMLERMAVPRVGTYCLTRFSQDGAWYRSMVEEIVNAQARVVFVDYGNNELKQCSDIYCLPPQFIDLCGQAQLFQLSTVVKSQNTEVQKKVAAILEGLISGKVLECFVSDARQGCIPEVVAKESDSPTTINDIICGELKNAESDIVLPRIASPPPMNVSESIRSRATSTTSNPSCDQGFRTYKTSDLSPDPFPSQGDVYVFVCHVTSPSIFWIQFPNTAKIHLEHLETLLSSTYADSTYCDYVPLRGELIVAKFTDGCWYRANVDCIYNDGTLRVTFIDFGNSEDIHLPDVRRITEELVQIPRLATRCALKCSLQVRNWSTEAIEFCKEAMLNKLCTACVSGPDNKSVLLTVNVPLEDGSVLNLNEELLKRGFAIPDTRSLSDTEDKQSVTSCISQRVSTPPHINNSQTVSSIKPTSSQNAPHVAPSQLNTPSATHSGLSISTYQEKISHSANHMQQTTVPPILATVTQVIRNDSRLSIVDTVNSATQLTSQPPDRSNPVSSRQTRQTSSQYAPTNPNQSMIDALNRGAYVGGPTSTSGANIVNPKSPHIQPQTSQISQSSTHQVSDGASTSSCNPAPPLNVDRNTNANAPSNHQPNAHHQPRNNHKLPRIDIPSGQFDVIVNDVVSVEDFYAQIIESGYVNKLHKCVRELNQFCNSSQPLNTTLHPGDLCCARFSQDKVWYRAKVLTLEGNGYNVCFVDFGNTEVVSYDVIRDTPELFYQMPALAIHCSLETGMNKARVATSTEQFRKLVRNKRLKCAVVDITSSPCLVKLEYLHYGVVHSVGNELEKIVCPRELQQMNKSPKRDSQRARSVLSEMVLIPAIRDAAIGVPGDPCMFLAVDGMHPTYFWVQPAHQQSIESLNKLTEELNIHYNATEYPPFRPTLNQFVACKFFSDNMWYRGFVKEEIPNGWSIHSVDFGKTKALSADRLRPLENRFLEQPYRALLCSLASLEPADGQFWSKDAIDYFRDKIRGKILSCRIVYNSSSRLFIDMEDPDVRGQSLRTSLLSKGMAKELGGFFLSSDPNKNTTNETPMANQSQPPDHTINANYLSDKQRGVSSHTSFKSDKTSSFAGTVPPFSQPHSTSPPVQHPASHPVKYEEGQPPRMDQYSSAQIQPIVHNPSDQKPATRYTPVPQVYDHTTNQPSTIASALRCASTTSVGDAKVSYTLKASGQKPSTAYLSNNQEQISSYTYSTISNATSQRQLAPNFQQRDSERQNISPVATTSVQRTMASSVPLVSVDRQSHFAVLVSEVVSPKEIYFNVAESHNAKLFDELSQSLNKNFMNSNGSYVPIVGELCCASFTVDKCWYRAVVRNIDNNNGAVTVQFVDYGNRDTVFFSAVRPITQQFSGLPLQARQASLAGVDTGTTWDEQRMTELRNTIMGKLLMVNVVNVVGTILETEFYDTSGDEDVFINGLFTRHPNVTTNPVASHGALTASHGALTASHGALTASHGALTASHGALTIPEYIPSGDELDVLVCEVVGPHCFWIQNVDEVSINQFATMTMDMNNMCSGNQDTLSAVPVSDVCCCKFAVDGQWYRARIEALLGDGRARVFYIDFGNRDEVDIVSLKPLNPTFATVPAQAIQCTLAKIRPARGTWSTKAVDWLKGRVLSKRLIARVIRQNGSVLHLELIDTSREHQDVIINAELVQMGEACCL